MARYRIGNDMAIIWSVTNKDGSSFPLAGKEVHLYYTCERGRFEVDIQIQDNVVAWDFAGRDQRVLGGYTLTLEVIQPGGKRIIRKDICNAFTLVGKECEENDTPGDADINEGGEITLVSELDVYKIQPIIPTVGSNSNWFVDGTDTGKPSTGKSAYEYAKEKGYEGTESEYAESLKLAPENAEKLTELSEETDLRFSESKQSIDAITEKTDNDIKNLAEDISDFKSAIVTQFDKYKPIEINGNVVNAADEEDITSEDNLLKFKNRNALNGMGYVILRKNKTLQEQIVNGTTIYEIRYDYDLDGSILTIPSNCVLKFIGGRIFNGTVVFDNTMIECESAINILPEQCSGYIKNKIIYPEWFIADADSTNGIQTAIDVIPDSGATILFTGDRYLVRGGVLLFKSNITFKSECNSTIYTADAENYQAIFFSNASVSSDNVTFDGLKFDQSAQVDCVINGEHAKMFCILTWKSVNLTVKNCKFINVGTNCVVCNGNECHNTSILNNYFHFLRCKNGGNYDNSVVYISDSYHRIEGNTIINDGSAENRSRGGIETHGTCGVVANNTISNCNVGINIVEINTTKEGIEPSRLITNNTCFNCTTFCAFWPVTEFKPIRNVTISNNKATNVINAVRTIISTNLKGTIENVEICNNYFEGRYKLIEEKLSNDELYEAAFALFGYGDILNFRIHNNVISSFPKCLLSTSPWSGATGDKSYLQEFYFTDNNCINCFNSTVKDSVKLEDNYTLFKVGIYTRMVVKDNIISIPEANRNGHLYAFMTMAYGIEGLVWENNKFTDVVTIDYTVGKSTDVSKIYSDLDSPGNKIYAFENIKNQCFYPGDVLIDQDSSLYVTAKGHKAPLPFEGIDATVAYQYIKVAFLSGTGIEGISVGDYLHLKLASAELYATVTEKTANGYYLTSTSIRSSVDGALVWLKHVVAKTKDYGKSYVFATGSEPEASFGTLGYNTTAKTPVSFNGSKWVDAFGFTPLPHAGTDASLPTTDKGLTPYDYGFTYYNYNSKKLLVWDSTQWINVDGSPTGMGSNRGGTSSRPTLGVDNAGFVYFDTTLKKPLWWTGSEWVDATGATV